MSAKTDEERSRAASLAPRPSQEDRKSSADHVYKGKRVSKKEDKKKQALLQMYGHKLSYKKREPIAAVASPASVSV